ncbi:MAG: hypothetical protein ACREE9_02445 [Stellaceae bacterium]
MLSVIGGAMLPHAPQFFTRPETEDRATVERVKAVGAEIGGRPRAMSPDLWISFANGRAEQFFHIAAPPFMIHVGGEARGAFAGHQFHSRAPGEIGFEIVRERYGQDFDPVFSSVAKIDYAIGIPLTHLGIDDPDEAGRSAFLTDAGGNAARFRLPPEQRTALIALDTRAIVAMGAHPLAPFLANMRIERPRRG